MDGGVFVSADGVWYVIDSITDATHLELTAVYGGGTLAGQTYNMYPRLPDRGSDGTANDGRIVWGANDHVEVSVDGLQSILDYVSESGEGVGAPDVFTTPGSLPGESTSENSSWPFYSLFHPAAVSLGWGSINLYGIMAIFAAIGIGVGVAIGTGSGLLAGLAVAVGLITGAGIGMLGWWIVVAYILFALAYLGATRSV